MIHLPAWLWDARKRKGIRRGHGEADEDRQATRRRVIPDPEAGYYWATNGAIALRTASDAGEVVPGNYWETLASGIRGARDSATEGAAHEGGLAVRVGRCWVDKRYVALVSQLYRGCTWRSSGPRNPVVAYQGEQPVSVVMGMQL